MTVIGVNEGAVAAQSGCSALLLQPDVRNVVRDRTVAEERASDEVSKMNGRYVKQFIQVYFSPASGR